MTRGEDGQGRYSEDGRPLVRLSGPEEMIEAIPHMLGFAPSESVVVQGFSGPRSRTGPVFRFDLVDGQEAANSLADFAVGMLRKHDMTGVFLAVFTQARRAESPGELACRELTETLAAACRAAGVKLQDAVLVQDGRWWSYQCDDPRCCPTEGTPLSTDVPSAAGLTLLTELGAPLPSREALEASVAAAVPEGFEAALDELRHGLAELDRASRVEQLLEIYDWLLAPDVLPDVEDTVLMLMIGLVQETLCRDSAVMGIGAAELPRAVELWRRAMVVCPDSCLPQVAAVLASLVWEMGGGALATIACDRGLALDPEHRLLTMTLTLIQNGVRPPRRRERRSTLSRLEETRRRMAAALQAEDELIRGRPRGKKAKKRAKKDRRARGVAISSW